MAHEEFPDGYPEHNIPDDYEVARGVPAEPYGQEPASEAYANAEESPGGRQWQAGHHEKILADTRERIEHTDDPVVLHVLQHVSDALEDRIAQHRAAGEAPSQDPNDLNE